MSVMADINEAGIKCVMTICIGLYVILLTIVSPLWLPFYFGIKIGRAYNRVKPWVKKRLKDDKDFIERHPFW